MSTKDVNYITVDNVSEIQDIVNGDYLFTISKGIVYKLDFQNFIVGKDNVDFLTTLDSLSAAVVNNTQSINALNNNNNNQITATSQTVNGQTVSVFEFILSIDDQGFADDSLENIISIGQALQAPYFEGGVAQFGQIGGNFAGPSAMPVIKIIADLPEYNFRNTVRIPPRFQFMGNTRWGSTIRLWSVGDKIIKDDNPAQHLNSNTFYNIGFYVEPGGNYTTILPNGELFTGTIRPIEQTIKNIIIVPQGWNNSNPIVIDYLGREVRGNKCPTIPIYIAGQPDRLNISDVKIIGTQGGNWLIKHGPTSGRNDYFNYFGVTQNDPAPFLIDSYFNDIQLEGDQILPANNAREVRYPSCGMFLTGANLNISNIRMFYLQQGIYIYNSRAITLSNITMDPTLAGFIPSLMPVTIVVPGKFATETYLNLDNRELSDYNEKWVNSSDMFTVPDWYTNYYSSKDILIKNQIRGIGSINMIGGNPQGLVTDYGVKVDESYTHSPYKEDATFTNWECPGSGLGMYKKDGVYGETYGTGLYNYNQWNKTPQSTIAS